MPKRQIPPTNLLKRKELIANPKLIGEIPSEETALVRSAKVICSLDLLLQLFQEKCRYPKCNLPGYATYTLIRTSVIIHWSCEGHNGKFYSSYSCNGIQSTKLQGAAAILFSGNNIAKVEKLATFLGLSFILIKVPIFPLSKNILCAGSNQLVGLAEKCHPKRNM